MALNKILTFCASGIEGTDYLSDANYSADSQRGNGNQPGVARAELVNKVLRQSSLLAAGIAQFIADNQAVDIVDSLTPAQIASYLLTAIGANVTTNALAGFNNLKLSATGTNANVSISADYVVLRDNTGKALIATAVSEVLNSAGTGVNGLDTSTVATGTWYSIWLIGKADGTIDSLMSTSATSPTMPSGYTFKARVGWLKTDSGSAYPLGFTQYGELVQLKVAAGSNQTQLPVLSSGVQGSGVLTSTPTWASVLARSSGPTNGTVPQTASKIQLLVNCFTNSAGAQFAVAPNNSYGGMPMTATNPPPMASNGYGLAVFNTEMLLESDNVYWVSGSASLALYCQGWRDNL